MHEMEESASEQPCEQKRVVREMSTKRHKSQGNGESKVDTSRVDVYEMESVLGGVDGYRVLGESGQGHRISKHWVRVWQR
jgi:hypothetical protein